MDYGYGNMGICRVQKIGAAKDIAGIQIHNRREREHSNTNPDIDRSRTTSNYSLKDTPERAYNALVDARLATGYTGAKAIRKDAVRLCEALFTASGEFFDLHPDRTEKYFRSCYEWACKRWGAENIISATVHMDEETPHMHLDFVPLTADGRLSAKSVLGGRKEMQLMQDDFFDTVAIHVGLNRGRRSDLDNPKAPKPRKHRTVREYKKETLDMLSEQERQVRIQTSILEKTKQQCSDTEVRLGELTQEQQQLESAVKQKSQQVEELRQQALEYEQPEKGFFEGEAAYKKRVGLANQATAVQQTERIQAEKAKKLTEDQQNFDIIVEQAVQDRLPSRIVERDKAQDEREAALKNYEERLRFKDRNLGEIIEEEVQAISAKKIKRSQELTASAQEAAKKAEMEAAAAQSREKRALCKLKQAESEISNLMEVIQNCEDVLDHCSVPEPYKPAYMALIDNLSELLHEDDDVLVR